MSKLTGNSEEQPPENSTRDDTAPCKNSNSTSVEHPDKLMELSEISMKETRREDLGKHNSESQREKEESVCQLKQPYVPSLRSRLGL